MKCFLVSLLLLSGVVAGLAADNSSLTGKWKVHYSISGNERDMDCTFDQKEQGLTGSCNSLRGPKDVTGKVTGKDVTWTYKSEYEGNAITVVYKGVVDAGNKIAGTVDVGELGVSGDFTAVPAK